MNTKLTASLVMLLFTFSFLNAQIVNCTPDPECEEVIPNNGMICPDQLPDGVEEEYYDETITIIPISQLQIFEIYSVVLDSVGGVPQGIEWGKCSEEFLVTDPLTRYCIQVYGTPEVAGEYPLKLYVTPFILDDGHIVEGPQQVDDTSFSITILPLYESITADFTSDIENISEGDFVNFTDLSEGNPTEWTWFFENGIPETSTSQHPEAIHYPNGGDCYDVKLIAAHEHDSDTITKQNYICVEDDLVYINKNMTNKIKLFPNPATSEVTVNSAEMIKSIRLIDANGKKLKTLKPNSDYIKIDITEFAKGNYYISITTKSGNYTKSVVIQ